MERVLQARGKSGTKWLRLAAVPDSTLVVTVQAASFLPQSRSFPLGRAAYSTDIRSMGNGRSHDLRRWKKGTTIRRSQRERQWRQFWPQRSPRACLQTDIGKRIPRVRSGPGGMLRTSRWKVGELIRIDAHASSDLELAAVRWTAGSEKRRRRRRHPEGDRRLCAASGQSKGEGRSSPCCAGPELFRSRCRAAGPVYRVLPDHLSSGARLERSGGFQRDLKLNDSESAGRFARAGQILRFVCRSALFRCRSGICTMRVGKRIMPQR